MYNMKNLKSFLLITIIAVVFASCGKDGAPGSTGPAGPEGSANVKIDTFYVQPSDWSFDGLGYVANIIPNFDPTKGAIIGYASYDYTNNFWMAMPWVARSSYDDDIDFQVTYNQITIYLEPPVGSSPLSPPSTTWYFKFFIIPPA
jgi:hypothetical protein